MGIGWWFVETKLLGQEFNMCVDVLDELFLDWRSLKSDPAYIYLDYLPLQSTQRQDILFGFKRFLHCNVSPRTCQVSNLTCRDFYSSSLLLLKLPLGVEIWGWWFVEGILKIGNYRNKKSGERKKKKKKKSQRRKWGEC